MLIGHVLLMLSSQQMRAFFFSSYFQTHWMGKSCIYLFPNMINIRITITMCVSWDRHTQVTIAMNLLRVRFQLAWHRANCTTLQNAGISFHYFISNIEVYNVVHNTHMHVCTLHICTLHHSKWMCDLWCTKAWNKSLAIKLNACRKRYKFIMHFMNIYLFMAIGLRVMRMWCVCVCYHTTPYDAMYRLEIGAHDEWWHPFCRSVLHLNFLVLIKSCECWMCLNATFSVHNHIFIDHSRMMILTFPSKVASSGRPSPR